jgi:hypothetical protein
MLLPWSKDELEQMLRDAVATGVEFPKLDLKQALPLTTAAEKVELAKDVAAIANTDGEENGYRGYGFIVLGASRGQLVGGVQSLSALKHDHTSAVVSQILTEYLGAVPAAHVFAFEDERVGSWGAIVIPPSTSQPHVFVRELNGRPRRGDWYVRVNDTTVLARPDDQARILLTATTRATVPLARQLAELESRVRLFDQSGPPQAEPDSTARALRTAASRITEMLRSPDDEVEEHLAAAAQKSWSAISSPDWMPWCESTTSTDAVQTLSRLEELARPSVEAIGETIRYDRHERFAGAIARAVNLLAEVPSPPPGISYQDGALMVRLYPLLLVVHALSALAAALGRSEALRSVLNLRLRPQFDINPSG